MAEDFDYKDKEHAELADAVLEVKKAVGEMGMRSEQVISKKIDELGERLGEKIDGLREKIDEGNGKLYRILVEIRDTLKK
jgi:hypothetical protein